MILAHYPLVRMIAERLVRRLPEHVRIGDLKGAGTIGLIQAVDRFDPSLGVPFRAYAEFRIHGAMIDELREADWVPRSVRDKLKRIEGVQRDLLLSLGRPPTQEEAAAALEMTPAEYEELSSGAIVLSLVSLDHGSKDGEDDHDQYELIPRDEEDVVEALHLHALMHAVRQAIADLPPGEREAFGDTFLGGQKLLEVAAVLRVTESRVCQLRGQAARRLRGRLRQFE
jgi:RNA polymerase sigma factor for flagellar operon FliA